MAVVSVNEAIARLGGPVVGLADVAVEADRRHGVHHAGVDRVAGLGPLPPVPRRPLRDEERAAQVHGQDRVPVVLGQVDEHAVAGDAGVVHDDVEPAPGVERGGEQPVGARRGRHVADVARGVGRPAGLAQRGDRLVDGRAVDVVDDHPGACGDQRLGVGSADAAGRAGDDADAALAERAHGCQPSRAAAQATAADARVVGDAEVAAGVVALAARAAPSTRTARSWPGPRRPACRRSTAARPARRRRCARRSRAASR